MYKQRGTVFESLKIQMSLKKFTVSKELETIVREDEADYTPGFIPVKVKYE